VIEKLLIRTDVTEEAIELRMSYGHVVKLNVENQSERISEASSARIVYAGQD
jgi:hypothetical protein